MTDGSGPADAPGHEVDRSGSDSWEELAARSGGGGGSESLSTVLIAFGANVLIALAKTAAAVVTGSASMVAEAAHSWADSGNEVFLLIANRRAAKPPDKQHPFGHGREVYFWSLFAAIGLFAVGAGVSVTHGIQGLRHPEAAESFVVAYVVLAISFVLEGTSLLQAWRQARAAADVRQEDLLDHIIATSDPTVRAVFFEDSAAIVGIVIAAVGIGLHELTGSSVPDAVGSILVGLLLGVVAILLIERNRDFLVGQLADPRARDLVLRWLLAQPEVERVSSLQIMVVGAGTVIVFGAVDLTGNAREGEVSHGLAHVEARLREHPAVVGVVLSLAEPEEPSLRPGTPT